MEKKLTNLTFFRVFMRSFLILGVCNYERMQNMGFLYMIAPVLKKIYPDKKELIESYKRHMEFFNTHPYFVTMPAGVIMAMEEQGVSGEKILEVKINMSGPIAAVGDSFFWAVWRPFVVFMVIAFMFLSGTIKINTGVFNMLAISKLELSIIVLLFLGLYNLPGLYIRYYCLQQGYYKKTAVVEIIRKITVLRLTENVRTAGFVLLILVLIVIFLRDLSLLWRAVIIIILPLIAWLLRKGVPVVSLFYGLIIFLLMMGYSLQ